MAKQNQETAGSSHSNTTTHMPEQDPNITLTPEQERRILSHFKEMLANPRHLSKNLAVIGILKNHMYLESGFQPETISSAFNMVLEPYIEMHYSR